MRECGNFGFPLERFRPENLLVAPNAKRWRFDAYMADEPVTIQKTLLFCNKSYNYFCEKINGMRIEKSATESVEMGRKRNGGEVFKV